VECTTASRPAPSSEVTTLPRKGRARRFREARELKQGFDDGLFNEGSGSLADVDENAPSRGGWPLDDEVVHDPSWDEEDPLKKD